jgi:hypothetical protein
MALALPLVFAIIVVVGLRAAYLAGFDQGRFYERARKNHPSSR